MTHQQRTLKGPVEINGVGLFTGRPVRVRCLPAAADSGVVFVRVDLPRRPEIACAIERLIDPGATSARATGVQDGDAQVIMIEHFTAALFGLRIDNLRVEVNSPEMPVGDGSALMYTEPFLRAGFEALAAPRRLITLERPVAIREDDVLLVAAPGRDGLTVTYVLDYGDRFFRCQVLTLVLDEESFVREIAPAKTFCLRPEIDFFRQRGLGKGASEENLIVVEPDGSMTGAVRFADECVRHKILDLLGDLFLAGGVAVGRLLGYKSGHGTNAALARALAALRRDN